MTDINNTTTVPTPVPPTATKPPTLPTLLTEHIDIDSRLARMERTENYFLALAIVYVLLLTANLVAVAFLLGHVR